jgi:hypothetical protein
MHEIHDHMYTNAQYLLNTMTYKSTCLKEEEELRSLEEAGVNTVSVRKTS